MKVSSSIRGLYDQQLDLNKQLRKRVDDIFIEGGNNGRWFYKGRLKELESFAQKIETGRFEPSALEDFFACTFVVENRNAILEAREFVEKHCLLQHQKPINIHITHKSPDAFPFDDLRLYVKLKPSERVPVNDLENITFEVQIKTFLQYAWSIATHDLIYKGQSINWGKARLAFQIKAMLEHAEISIEQANNISDSPSLAMIDNKTKMLKEIIEWLVLSWSQEQLPTDIVRLGHTLLDIMKYLKIKLKELQLYLTIDTELGMGTKLQNLSPYEIIIKSIVNHNLKNFLHFVNTPDPSLKFRLLITPEMELEEILKNCKNDKIINTKNKQ